MVPPSEGGNAMSVNIWLERITPERIDGRYDAVWQDELHFCIDKFETAALAAMHRLQEVGLLTGALDLGFLAGEELDESSMLMGPEEIRAVRSRLGPLGEWFATTFETVFDPAAFEAAEPLWNWREAVRPGTGEHFARVMADTTRSSVRRWRTTRWSSPPTAEVTSPPC